MAFRRQVNHNQHRRSFYHDYHEKGIYMVTMVIEGRKPLFGRIEGSTFGHPDSSEAPHVALSELGHRVLEQEVPKISRFYRQVEVWRVAIMPDHIHLLLRVREPLPDGKHLGMVVRGFKTGCSRAWWQWQDETGLGGETPSTAAPSAASSPSAAPPCASSPSAAPSCASAPSAAPPASSSAAVPKASPLGKPLRPVLFASGYHDRIINRPGMLENIKRYMAENPLRARIRQECPHLMERQLHLWIAGREYAAFGNLFLLKYPIKEQVFFHRKDPSTGKPTELTEAYAHARDRLLKVAEEGTVLVTPGISTGEKLVVEAALDNQLPLIILQKEHIGEYWKPSRRRFYACATGYLLLLSPWQVDGDSDYSRFHHLNDLAGEICAATDMRILGYSGLRQV